MLIWKAAQDIVLNFLKRQNAKQGLKSALADFFFFKKDIHTFMFVYEKYMKDCK